MSELKKVRLTSIDENPFRDLNTYPWIKKKLESLQRSISDVGFWEGVIVRQVGKRYQAAFGHHRIEAAKRSGLSSIPVIVRDLSDEQMLQFMGRENGEDYSTDFLVMLNTWEGAVAFSRVPGKSQKGIEIARMLGWVRDDKARMTEVGDVCNKAHALIEAGHMDREDLAGLAVYQAREIVGRTADRINKIADRGSKMGHTEEQISVAQETVAKAGKRVAKMAKEGKVATKQLRSEVDVEAFKQASTTKPTKQLLFASFGDSLANTIAKSLSADSVSEKLDQIVKSLGLIELDDDKRVVDRINYELGEMAGRAEKWQSKMVISKTVEKRITNLLAIEGGKK